MKPHRKCGWRCWPSTAQHLAFDGRANFLATARRQSVVAKLSSLTAMVAAYVDLPGLGLPRLGPLEPFVGAGVGAARTWVGERRMTFPATTTIVHGRRAAPVSPAC